MTTVYMALCEVYVYQYCSLVSLLALSITAVPGETKSHPKTVHLQHTIDDTSRHENVNNMHDQL